MKPDRNEVHQFEKQVRDTSTSEESSYSITQRVKSEMGKATLLALAAVLVTVLVLVSQIINAC